MEANTRDDKLREWRQCAATRSPESAAFIEGIFAELEGNEWVKEIIAGCLTRDPDEAIDGLCLALRCLEMQAQEIDGSAKFDDDDPL